MKMQDGICNIKDGVSVLGARLPQAVGSYLHHHKCLFKWYRLLLPGIVKTSFMLFTFLRTVTSLKPMGHFNLWMLGRWDFSQTGLIFVQVLLCEFKIH